MMDYMSIGCAPYGEDCVQVGTENYAERAKLECEQYIKQLIRTCGEPIGSACLRIKSNPHDFGTYYEVVCYYDTGDEEALQYALKCEGEGPENWDDQVDLPWLNKIKAEQKANEVRFNLNVQAVKELCNGNVVMWNGYKEFNPDYTDHPMDSFTSWRWDLDKYNDLLFYMTTISGSDYGGSLVDKANYNEFIEMYGEEPGVYRLYGGFDSFGIALRLCDLANTDIWETLKSLEDYPLINDEALSNLESEQETEAWNNWADSEFKSELAAREFEWGDKIYKVELYDISSEDLLALFLKCKERSNEEWFTECMDRTIRIEEVVKVCKIEDLIPIENVTWFDGEDNEVSKPWVDTASGVLF